MNLINIKCCKQMKMWIWKTLTILIDDALIKLSFSMPRAKERTNNI